MYEIIVHDNEKSLKCYPMEQMEDLTEGPVKVPDFDAMVQELLVRWRALPADEKNDHGEVKALLGSYSLSLEDQDRLGVRLDIALRREGYTGPLPEGLRETYRHITRLVLERFIRF